METLKWLQLTSLTRRLLPGVALVLALWVDVVAFDANAVWQLCPGSVCNSPALSASSVQSRCEQPLGSAFDRRALCVGEAICREECAKRPDCHSISVSNSQQICFLKPMSCEDSENWYLDREYFAFVKGGLPIGCPASPSPTLLPSTFTSTLPLLPNLPPNMFNLHTPAPHTGLPPSHATVDSTFQVNLHTPPPLIVATGPGRLSAPASQAQVTPALWPHGLPPDESVTNPGDRWLVHLGKSCQVPGMKMDSNFDRCLDHSDREGFAESFKLGAAAICLDVNRCMQLCDQTDGCFAVEMSQVVNRCELKGTRCTEPENWVASGNMNLLVVGRNQESTQAASCRSYTCPKGYELRPDEISSPSLAYCCRKVKTAKDCSSHRTRGSCPWHCSWKYGTCKAVCRGNSETWDAGWGGCATYLSGRNHAWCDFDSFQGLLAREVCAGCGECDQMHIRTPAFHHISHGGEDVLHHVSHDLVQAARARAFAKASVGEDVLHHVSHDLVQAARARAFAKAARAAVESKERDETMEDAQSPWFKRHRSTHPHRSKFRGVEHYNAADIALAWCSIFGILVAVIAMRLVLSRSKSLGKQLWSVSSTLVAVLVATLLFSTIRRSIDLLVGGEDPFWAQLLPAYGFFLCIFLMLQASLVFGLTKDLTHSQTMEELSRMEQVRRSLILQGPEEDSFRYFVSILLSYMCGFAATDAGGALQHAGYFGTSHGVFKAVEALLLHQLLLMVLEHMASLAIRRWRRDAYSTWLEALQDLPIAMSMAFLAVEVFSFELTGVFPEQSVLGRKGRVLDALDGEVPPMRSTLFLYLVGFVALGACMKLSGRVATCEQSLYRLLALCQRASALAAAWSFLRATRWLARRLCVLTDFHQAGALAREFGLVVVLSIPALLVAVWLERVEVSLRVDTMQRARTSLLALDGPEADYFRYSPGRIALVSALGVILGVAWEGSVSRGVTAAASVMPRSSELAAQEILVTLVALLIVLVWCWMRGPEGSAYSQISPSTKDARPDPHLARHATVLPEDEVKDSHPDPRLARHASVLLEEPEVTELLDDPEEAQREQERLQREEAQREQERLQREEAQREQERLQREEAQREQERLQREAQAEKERKAKEEAAKAKRKAEEAKRAEELPAFEGEELLLDIGFTKVQARKALARTNGNVEEAMELLLDPNVTGEFLNLEPPTEASSSSGGTKSKEIRADEPGTGDRIPPEPEDPVLLELEEQRRLHVQGQTLLTREAAYSLMSLGAARGRHGDYRGAMEAFEESRQAYAHVNLLETEEGVALLSNMAFTQVQRGDHQAAVGLYEEAKAICERRDLLDKPSGQRVLRCLAKAQAER
eukprot:TRINITY_DN2308_c0_g1_i3.p1 TRINITY_DN2308_c0_g1~~TRINITY_DN2308_c0_g1_i3.p1  ORF type:complete len:1341 (-),score=244.81 TRINITY_DN2308_c0_g1_i3:106-4128(-)